MRTIYGFPPSKIYIVYKNKNDYDIYFGVFYSELKLIFAPSPRLLSFILIVIQYLPIFFNFRFWQLFVQLWAVCLMELLSGTQVRSGFILYYKYKEMINLNMYPSPTGFHSNSEQTSTKIFKFLSNILQPKVSAFFN